MLPPQLLLPLPQSLLNQHQHLPKLKIKQQPRGRHLNAVESALEAAEAADMAAEEDAEVAVSGMEDALEDLAMAATDC